MASNVFFSNRRSGRKHFSRMYITALDYVSLMKVNDQSQFHLFIIHQYSFHLNKLYHQLQRKQNFKRGLNPSFHTTQSFSSYVKSQLLKLSYLLLQEKWKLKYEPPLIFRHTYNITEPCCHAFFYNSSSSSFPYKT